jgi:hypothetical protein
MLEVITLFIIPIANVESSIRTGIHVDRTKPLVVLSKVHDSIGDHRKIKPLQLRAV